MRVLVTGSSGTIGTRLCERLLAEGHDVQGLDRVPNKWQPAVQAVTIICDLTDAAAVAKLSVEADVLVHLAAYARVYELVEHPDRALANVVSTFQALELARRCHVTRFLFASSRETYGNIGAERYTEDLVRVHNCESPYTASKLAGEAFVESYARCYDMDQMTVRFSNVYGMYDDSERVVPEFIRRCKRGEPLVVYGKDKCLDFTYIDDAVAGVMLMLQHFDTAKNDVYNLAYGEGSTIMELAELIQRLVGTNVPVSAEASRTGEVTRYVADITKARTALGYDPKTPFNDGIAKAVEWYLAHPEIL